MAALYFGKGGPATGRGDPVSRVVGLDIDHSWRLPGRRGQAFLRWLRRQRVYLRASVAAKKSHTARLVLRPLAILRGSREGVVSR